ncbi:MAG: HutP family protein [Proteocatella sp.]
MKNKGIGKISLLFALTDNYDEMKLKYENKGYKIIRGNAGSMDAKKILAAIEVAATREGLISDNYHDEHALYHATVEALQGYCRGQVALGEILRTAGLTYTVVKGPLIDKDDSNGMWISVVLFGEIGSPRKGFEHEAIGMGIQPI